MGDIVDDLWCAHVRRTFLVVGKFSLLGVLIMASYLHRFLLLAIPYIFR